MRLRTTFVVRSACANQMNSFQSVPDTITNETNMSSAHYNANMTLKVKLCADAIRSLTI